MSMVSYESRADWGTLGVAEDEKTKGRNLVHGCKLVATMTMTTRVMSKRKQNFEGERWSSTKKSSS